MHGISRLGAVVATLVTCAACVDPGGEFDDFVGRAKRAPRDAGEAGASDASTCSVSPGDVSGDYLFALSVSIAPATPVVALVTLSTPALDGGTGLSLEAQPLSTTDRRTPVGDSFSAGPFPVDAQGRYTISIPDLRIGADANPITHAEIAASVELTGNLCGDGSFFCGDASGNVTSPITLDLSGSTFTMTRIDDPANPPTRPALNCAGDLADPVGD